LELQQVIQMSSTYFVLVSGLPPDHRRPQHDPRLLHLRGVHLQAVHLDHDQEEAPAAGQNPVVGDLLFGQDVFGQHVSHHRARAAQRRHEEHRRWRRPAEVAARTREHRREGRSGLDDRITDNSSLQRPLSVTSY